MYSWAGVNIKFCRDDRPIFETSLHPSVEMLRAVHVSDEK